MDKNISDLDVAMFLAGHIINPCETKVGDRYENIRGFYIRLAKEDAIPKMSDKVAIDYLNRTIKDFE